jgi:hypothetical protein
MELIVSFPTYTCDLCVAATGDSEVWFSTSLDIYTVDITFYEGLRNNIYDSNGYLVCGCVPKLASAI